MKLILSKDNKNFLEMGNVVYKDDRTFYNLPGWYEELEDGTFKYHSELPIELFMSSRMSADSTLQVRVIDIPWFENHVYYIRLDRNWLLPGDYCDPFTIINPKLKHPWTTGAGTVYEITPPVDYMRVGDTLEFTIKNESSKN